MGHLNGFFAPRGGNLNKPIFKSSNAGGGGGWMLKLRFDWWCIIPLFSPKRGHITKNCMNEYGITHGMVCH